jgi:hypothetical protein
MLYKKVKSQQAICREISGLLGSKMFNIQAPRLVGLIGVGTEWGGILMTQIHDCYDLSELEAPSAC